MNKLLNNLEKIFTISSLIIYSTGIILLIISGGANESDVEVNYNTSLYQAIFIFIYLLTFMLLILRWKKLVFIFKSNKLIWLLLFLTIISVTWSFDPTKTLKDSFRLIGSSAFGIYLASRYTLKEQLKILGLTLVIIVLLSFLFAIALPKYGIMGGIHAGKWRGIFMHKNGLGSMMITSCITFILRALNNSSKAWFYWLNFILSLILLIFAVSTSSVINLTIIIGLLVCLRCLWLPYIVMVPTVIGISLLIQIFYFWFTSNVDVLFGYFGKDTNLSGRTDLWPLVFDMIWKQPWLGYGYSAFWNGWNGESAYIWRIANWTPTHPHNGFLELWLDLGLLGLIVFILGFCINYARSIALIRMNRNIENLLPALHLSLIILSNITETALLKNDSFTWIMYISLSSSTIIYLNQKSNKFSI